MSPARKHTELASNIQETCGITPDETEAQIKHCERRDKDEQSADSYDTVRLGETGYSSPGCVCPRCNGMTARVPRRLVDLLASMFVTVSRYRCCSTDCGWTGNLRVKRRALLIQFP